MGYPGFMLLIYGICVSNLFWHNYGFKITKKLFNLDQIVLRSITNVLGNFNFISNHPLEEQANASDEDTNHSEAEAEAEDQDQDEAEAEDQNQDQNQDQDQKEDQNEA